MGMDHDTAHFYSKIAKWHVLASSKPPKMRLGLLVLQNGQVWCITDKVSSIEQTMRGG